MNEIRRTSDMSEVKLDEVLVELTALKAKYQKAVEAIIILVDDAEFYGGDVRKLTAFSRIKSLAAELGEKE